MLVQTLLGVAESSWIPVSDIALDWAQPCWVQAQQLTHICTKADTWRRPSSCCGVHTA